MVKEMACVIEQEVKRFTRTSPLNRMPHDNDELIFGEPLVQFANGDDPIFSEYKTIIDPSHLTPREVIDKALDSGHKDTKALTVISWVLPVTEATRQENRCETFLPSRRWSHTRYYGEKFNDALREQVVKFLTGMGYLAVAPPLHPCYRVEYEEISEKGYFSTWSERHIAYACGLGTFSLSDGFITESGIAHRCGSVVTNLSIPASPRIAKDHLSNCLFYTDSKCVACVSRCPVGAITEKGHDKTKCMKHLCDIGYLSEKGEVIEIYDDNSTPAGCGLCQTKVPCEFRNPNKSLKK